METDDITDAGDMADKCSIFFAVFDMGNIAFVGHRVHGAYYI